MFIVSCSQPWRKLTSQFRFEGWKAHFYTLMPQGRKKEINMLILIQQAGTYIDTQALRTSMAWWASSVLTTGVRQTWTYERTFAMSLASGAFWWNTGTRFDHASQPLYPQYGWTQALGEAPGFFKRAARADTARRPLMLSQAWAEPLTLFGVHNQPP